MPKEQARKDESKVIFTEQTNQKLPSITIKWQGTSKQVSYKPNATVGDLSTAIHTLLDIPPSAQKLFSKHLNVLKIEEAKKKPMADFRGKKILLLGHPQKDIDSARKAATANRERHAKSQERLHKALERFRPKIINTRRLVGTGRPPSPLNPTELTEGESYDTVSRYRRFFGRRAPDMGSTYGGSSSKERFEAYMGTGLFPRLQCRHISGKFSACIGEACEDCRNIFVCEWYVFVAFHLRELLQDARRDAMRDRTSLNLEMVQTLDNASRQLDAQAEFGLNFGAEGIMCELLDDWYEEMDFELMCPQNPNEDDVPRDLDSFNMILEFLHGEDSRDYPEEDQDEHSEEFSWEDSD